MFDCTNYKNCPKNKSFLEGKKYKLKENFNFFLQDVGVFIVEMENIVLINIKRMMMVYTN